MNSRAIAGAVVTLAVVAAVIFVGVAAHELSYATAHPHQYGPANVIAVLAAGGATLAIATALIGLAALRTRK